MALSLGIDDKVSQRSLFTVIYGIVLTFNLFRDRSSNVKV
jgi:hypothetical protein